MTNSAIVHQLAMRLPDGTVSNLRKVDPVRSDVEVSHLQNDIANTVVEARAKFGVGADYQPELVHRTITTTYSDWVSGAPRTEPETDEEN
ncbi:hypothetical protein [Nocardia salmonicida]|uniref:hypothetical protein n=1 Tax=Nocardia salmonicida TaxID=53431 RepID=UPI00363C3F3A